MSVKINVYNQKCETVSEMKLSDQVFGVKTNEVLVHQAIITQMANERQVLAHTKGRSDVQGGGRKPWRQKGTGRARAGSIRSPIWKGGGVTFGPTKDRNFKKNINKKMRQKAMLMVLSDRVANKNLAVLDKLEMDEFKTKVFIEVLDRLEKKAIVDRQLDDKKDSKPRNVKKRQDDAGKTPGKEGKTKQKRSILLINDKKDEKVKYSGRNLAGIKIINLNNINILDLLKFRNVILTKDGVRKLEDKYK